MKVQKITVSGGVRLSREYQSADTSFAVEVTLDEGENPRKVHTEVYRSMMAHCRTEAQAALREAIYTVREMEGI